MNNIDQEIFESVVKSKKMTEIYLGSVSYPWLFSKAQYTAECTEAVQLTPFEKAICGLLNVDGTLGKKQVAEILGLNTESNPEQLVFKDPAEDEILLDNLESLFDYDMIERTDGNYSSFTLTDIGKEYFSQGKKFKKGIEKSFTIFYDIMTNKHKDAKKIFGQISARNETLTKDIPPELSDEHFIKSFANDQIPLIYDEIAGNSFTNLVGKGYTVKKTYVCIGVLYDVLTKNIRLVIQPSPTIDAEYLREAIEDNGIKNDIVNQFLTQKTGETALIPNPLQSGFEDSLIKLQSDVDYDLEYLEDHEKATSEISEYEKNATIFEEGKLYSLLSEELGGVSNKETYLNIPELNQCDTNNIKSLSSKNNVNIYLTTTKPEEIDDTPGIMVAKSEQEEELIILEDSYITPSALSFSILGQTVAVKCYERHFGNTDKLVRNQKKIIASAHLSKYVDSYELFVNSDDLEATKENFSIIEHSRDDINKFEEFVDELGYSEILSELDSKKDQMLTRIKNEYLNHLKEEFMSISEIDINSVEDLKTISLLLEKVNELQERLKAERDTMNDKWYGEGYVEMMASLEEKTETFKAETLNHEKRLRLELIEKIYVIDTNIFVECPDILDYIDKKDKVLVSYKVLDELDKLKTKLTGNEKKNVKEAIKEINHALRMKRIETKKSNLRDLPIEFQRESGDYMILSVAYGHKDQNVFLLTNDINFQNIAMSLEIHVKSLNDIKKS